MHEETLFHHALGKPAGQRAAFLDAACGGDAALRRRVEALLAAHEAPGSFLAGPAGEPGPTVGPRPAERDGGGEPAAGGRVGPYKLLQQIGEGGMGTVWMAEQEHPVRRRVALKLIKPGAGGAQVVARFEAERQALALMDHPNIAKVLDAGTTAGEPGGVSPGRPYFVMELVKGTALTKHCDDRRLTLRERLGLFVPVCQGVQHAHQKGVIHRDLKPSNVLVAGYDGAPVPKVIDFGVAKATGMKLTDRTLFTDFGAVVGTLEYMSPEQAEPNQLDIDTRSDVYSLGVLLYELLTGTTPLERQRLKGASLLDVLRRIREEEPPTPSARLSTTQELPGVAARRATEPRKLCGLVRGELDWILMKCLDKDRNRRYETADGLARDLQRYLQDEPVLAGPPGAAYQLRKFFVRHRGPVLAAAGLLALLVAGVVGTGTGLLRALKAEGLANDRLGKVNQAYADLQEKEQQTERALTHQLIAMADREWSLNHVDKMRELLEACPPGRRHWEWHYLRRLPGKELLAFGQKGSRVKALAFSPDGRLLATTGAEVKLWDAATGRVLRTLARGDDNVMASAIAFSPDGRLLAAFVPARKGDPQIGPPNRPTPYRAVKVWEVSSGKERFTLPGGTAPTGGNLSFSPDGKRLATAGLGFEKPHVWDAATGALVDTLHPRRTVPRPHFGALIAVAFSPDGGRVATGRAVMDVAAKNELFTLDGVGGPARLAFSPDGRLLAAAERVNRVFLYDAKTGHLRHALRIPLDEEDDPVPPPTLAFSRDGRWLATPGKNRTAVVWDTTNGQEARTFRGHTTPVSSVALRPDGKRLAAATLDGTIKVWDATAPQEAQVIEYKQLFRPPQGKYPEHAFSPRGDRWAVSHHSPPGPGQPYELKVLDVPSCRQVTVLRTAERLVPVAFSPDGRRLAAVEGKRTLSVWDVPDAREVLTLRGRPAVFPQAAFSADGTRLLTNDATGALRVVEVATGRELFRDPDGKSCWPLALSPDGKLVAAGLRQDRPRGRVVVWDVASGDRLCTLAGHTDHVRTIAFRPDGRHLATAGADKVVRTWDAATGQALRVFRGHAHRVNGLAFTAHGQRLFSGCTDKTVKVWDAATGRELLTLRGHGGGVEGLAFHPGRQCLVSRTDTKLRIWDGAPWREPPKSNP